MTGKDGNGKFLDGGKNYKLSLPKIAFSVQDIEGTFEVWQM
jgi:hypothetical protein